LSSFSWLWSSLLLFVLSSWTLIFTANNIPQRWS
jgi:hypothetical protein